MKAVYVRFILLMSCFIGFTAFVIPSKPGGEGFDIFWNGKAVLERYGSLVNQPGHLDLRDAKPADELLITYYHCGQPAKGRVLQLNDAKGNLLRSFIYGDAKTASAGMIIRVRELPAHAKSSEGVQLVYHSDMKHPPRMLATIRY